MSGEILRLPPGLSEFTALEILASENDLQLDWDTFEFVKQYTNAFIIEPNGSKMLLGMKKRGFGVNLYNGFGGKVDPGETPLVAAKRELKEEAGIEADLVQCGILFFKLADLNFAHKVFIFRAEAFSGEITESEEMRPEWFSIDTIPFQTMWEDDRLWFPMLLGRVPFAGRVDFGPSPAGDEIGTGAPMVRSWFARVNQFQAP